jgi:hypothetical protein
MPKELALEAFDGWTIPNEIGADPSANAVALTRESIDRLILARARQLTRPTGRYNCHGLTFACRRTNVDGPTHPVDIEELMRHDAFVQVTRPQTGDVVVYRNLRGNIEHTGLVSRIEELGSVIYVWSAWGCLGEFEHPERACPYGPRIEYWRLP